MSAKPQALQPRNPAHLFWVFTRLALQGFGGVLAVAQRELVEREGWIRREDFLAVLAVSQVLPGPNVVNLAIILGDRWFGWRGAAAALGGLLAVPLCIVLALAFAWRQYQHEPAVAGALRGMAAASAGLIAGTAIKLSSGLKTNVLGPWGCTAVVLAATVALGALRLPMVAVVLGLGGTAAALAWWRLRA